MTYLAHPMHYTLAEFRTMLTGLKFDKGWRPQFPTLHNTGVPSLAQWRAMGAVPQERWGSSLNAYYRGMGWHSAIHLVCCPDYIWNLCDLEYDGVSVSCWNHVTLGIEMVGSYEIGGDDFSAGDGAKVRDNAVFVLAALCEKFGWDIAKVLHFHRECVTDHHACPGSKVAKLEVIHRVDATLASWGRPVPVAPPSPAAPVAAAVPPMARPDALTTTGLQQALNKLGFQVVVDGQFGPQTEAAVKSFQGHVGLTADGIPGPETMAAVLKALRG